MLVGLVGGICAGKTSVREYLQRIHGFVELKVGSVKSDPCSSSLTCMLHRTTDTIKVASPVTLLPNQPLCKTFANVAQLCDYATEHWQLCHIVEDIDCIPGWEVMLKRPFFLLVAVEAPLYVRWMRLVNVGSSSSSTTTSAAAVGSDASHRRNCSCISSCHCHTAAVTRDSCNDDPTVAASQSPSSADQSAISNPYIPLEHFVQCDDQRMFQPNAGNTLMATTRSASSSSSTATSLSLRQHGCKGSNGLPLYLTISKADVRIVNTVDTLPALYDLLEKVDLLNPSRLRPNWDTYFMELCHLASRRSNCMKRRVGCIIVNDHRVIATGYNGTPRGVRNCNEGGCKRCNENSGCGLLLDTCLCLHAEENALLEAGRDRIFNADFDCQCLGCAKKIVQVGVKEVVYSDGYGMDDMTAALFHAGGITLRQHSILGRLYPPHMTAVKPAPK
ncbi:hypothetical protein BSLG_003174 [Batrachochytrium salamandrivorans]|nr:hypothetical protein BSLG_003174 [Batrachochytrium salamandrivorans]